jgi:ABC-2 type transport system permease protein
MSKTLTILTNELVSTLRRKGFIITTLAIPVLALLGVLVMSLINIMSGQDDEISQIGIVDQTGKFNQFLIQKNVEFIQYDSEGQAVDNLVDGNIEEYIIIPPDYMETGNIYYFSTKTSITPPSYLTAAARDFLIDNLISDKLEPELTSRLQSPMNISSITLNEEGEISDGQGGFGAWIIAYLFAILLMLSIFTASGYLLQGLSEEKENRVMEVLLSSVSTRQMITGKVLGLGIAGLIQIVFWLLSASLMLNAAGNIGQIFSGIQFPADVITLGLVYFILGYLLFAILMAGTGAVSPTMRDSQQFTVVFSLIAAVPFFLMTFIIENGDHIVNIILTLFPLTAPLTVMMRINAGIPLWEIILSIILMSGTIVGLTLLVSRIFRVYLLMYGKPPGWKEIYRSIKQA